MLQFKKILYFITICIFLIPACKQSVHISGQDCNYELREYVPETCLNDGYKRFSCSICGHSRFEYISKIPHSYGEQQYDNVLYENYRECNYCGHRTYSEFYLINLIIDVPEYIYYYDKIKVKVSPHANNGKGSFTILNISTADLEKDYFLSDIVLIVTNYRGRTNQEYSLSDTCGECLENFHFEKDCRPYWYHKGTNLKEFTNGTLIRFSGVSAIATSMFKPIQYITSIKFIFIESLE